MRRGAKRGTLGETETKGGAMAKTLHGEPAQAGDEIVVEGRAVGQTPKTAVIVEVLGDEGHERFRVRWEDGHESILFPGEDATVRRPRSRRAKSSAT
jgi:hypothetical protein